MSLDFCFQIFKRFVLIVVFLKIFSAVESASYADGKKIPLHKAPLFQLDQKVFDNVGLELIHHTGKEAFQSYLAMVVQYEPVRSLRVEVEKKFGVRLKNRGEAHITVITPPEFDQVLSKKNVDIETIHKIASVFDIQKSEFKILCLGEGVADLNGKEEKTYFLVVESEDLLEIRRKIEQLFLEKGGSLENFSAKHFYPHITLGYTDRDLFESDGVIKDIRTCVGKIETP